MGRETAERENYRETLDYLFGLQRFGIKLGLANITALLKHLGDPHARLQTIHIAGSNGKGSTAAFLASILAQIGLRVGLYTSPHLSDFRERIRILSRRFNTQPLRRSLRDFEGAIPQKSLAAASR